MSCHCRDAGATENNEPEPQATTNPLAALGTRGAKSKAAPSKNKAGMKAAPATSGKHRQSKSLPSQEEPEGVCHPKKNKMVEKQPGGRKKQSRTTFSSKARPAPLTDQNQLPLLLDDSENEEPEDDDEGHSDNDEDEFREDDEDDTNSLSEDHLQEIIGKEGACVVSHDQAPVQSQLALRSGSQTAASHLFNTDNNMVQAKHSFRLAKRQSTNQARALDIEGVLDDNDEDDEYNKDILSGASGNEDEYEVEEDEDEGEDEIEIEEEIEEEELERRCPSCPKVKVLLRVILVEDEAVIIVKLTAATINAWPECIPGGWEKYRQIMLLEACQKLVGNGSRVHNIIGEIEDGDSKLSACMGNWVVDHLCLISGIIVDVTCSHMAIFQLGVKDICMQCIEQLKIADVYIYPGKWGQDNQNPGKEVGCYNSNKIYQNEALMDMIVTSGSGYPPDPTYQYSM
ncbi:hypothetical protein NP233_g10890 [Leucocoprinus birnbaumii]|uniref:Uncharacterized protein n=1 Tax=Leucocoprinus birnbaumii TaxID=56174 RepID=A0AAD5VI05_9AGAR|nr:hypothetical protein NP233_g10890 [Leucocoprinus birnbaumii]